MSNTNSPELEILDLVLSSNDKSIKIDPTSNSTKSVRFSESPINSQKSLIENDNSSLDKLEIKSSKSSTTQESPLLTKEEDETSADEIKESIYKSKKSSRSEKKSRESSKSIKTDSTVKSQKKESNIPLRESSEYIYNEVDGVKSDSNFKKESESDSSREEPKYKRDDDNDCKWNKYMAVIVIAIIITIIFLILAYPMLDIWMTMHVEDSTYRWLLKALLFFILLVIILAIASMFIN